MKGVVVFHDALRRWISLQLDQPVCSQNVIQLLDGADGAYEVDERNAKSLETFRGCRATVTGTLNLSGTGYYSADVYQNVQTFMPDPSCVRQPPFPDTSHLKPDNTVQRYQVKLMMSHLGEGSIHAEVRNQDRKLVPWQAYTHYFLTGGFAFYGYCSDGFVMSHLSGSPEAKPWTMDNYAIMDPEGAAEKKVEPVVMTFICSRERSRKVGSN